MQVEDKEILKGLCDLEVKEETHALTGPASSKSTLLATIAMGNRNIRSPQGEILLDGRMCLSMEVDERKQGRTVSGDAAVSQRDQRRNEFRFSAHTAINARREAPIPAVSSSSARWKTISALQMKEDPWRTAFSMRALPAVKKKRNEIIR